MRLLLGNKAGGEAMGYAVASLGMCFMRLSLNSILWLKNVESRRRRISLLLASRRQNFVNGIPVNGATAHCAVSSHITSCPCLISR